MVRIDWDDPRSQFNGVKREMYFNQTVLTNPGGPTLWWTDPLGRQAVPDAVRAARPQAYVGFVRHWVHLWFSKASKDVCHCCTEVRVVLPIFAAT